MQKEKILLMGILNITPDSFSDGGLYNKSIKQSLKRVEQMIHEGANIIDIGGESTRPGAEPVSENEEMKRVLPVITAVRKAFPKIPLAIDTRKAYVAQNALSEGCSIINSLGGFTFDEDLASVAAKHKCKVMMYHIKGDPKTMQKGEITYTDIVKDITTFFKKQITFGESQGMKRKQFILDPGIGFGKTDIQNLEIIRRFEEFTALSLPLAIGVSRKSHLARFLQDQLKLDTLPNTDERLEAALAETAIAVQKGAAIIRTHDVGQTKKFVTMLEALIK
jgi:dihydropteroate synthase